MKGIKGFIKGYIPWNKDLTKETDSRVASIANSLTGQKHSEECKKKISKSLKGHPVSQETRRKISESEKGKLVDEIARRNISISHLGKIPWNKGLSYHMNWNPNSAWSKGLTKETHEGLAKIGAASSIAIKRRLQDPVFFEKWLKSLQRKPTKPEIKLTKMLDTFFSKEFTYNGDLSLGIVLNRLIPDFVNVNGKKQVIELFGDYWHRGENPQEKINRYREVGFECLVIWESELKDENKVIQKINNFLSPREENGEANLLASKALKEVR